MQIPLQIIFHNMEPSDAVEANIKEKAAKLERFSDKITSCRVTVEAPHKHHHKGNIYHIAVDIVVPDAEVVVSRSPQDNHAHEDIYVAIRDSFNSARRQLEDYELKRRGKIKSHQIYEPVPGQLAE
ncbi:MAG: HPF/RaiA family ribosome-associated protein [Gammaproteobacteria bacterium]|nr:HPF/RaiA family ribosome-associated protein [Gammaproteobacteria bacterium]